jgi:thiamine biosynthesis lipoprotein
LTNIHLICILDIVENFVFRGTYVLPLFSALCLIFNLTACEKTETVTLPLLDTAVTVTSHGELPVSSIEAVLTEVSDKIEPAFGTPAKELEDPMIPEIVGRIEMFRAFYGGEVDINIGALTRLWGISTDNPRVPADEEIAAALTDYTYLDLGAVAKGFALDRVYAALLEADTDTESGYAIISAESSILLYGKKPGGKPFKTAIKDPLNPGEYVGYIETEAVFISTSGGSERFFEADGQRYSHILDPATGYPARTDLASVTVIVPADLPDGGILSDFFSTLIFIRGVEGLEYLSEYEGGAFAYIAIDKDGNIYGNQRLIPI